MNATSNSNAKVGDIAKARDALESTSLALALEPIARRVAISLDAHTAELRESTAASVRLAAAIESHVVAASRLAAAVEDVPVALAPAYAGAPPRTKPKKAERQTRTLEECVFAALRRIPDGAQLAVIAAMVENDPLAPKHGRKSISPCLSSAFREGKLARTGSGHGGDPFIYRLAERTEPTR